MISEEEYKDIRITREDLIDWIERPPRDEDIELCDYLVNALDNQFKYYNEIKQLKDENNKIKTRNSKQRIANKKLKQKYQQLDIKHDNLLITLCRNNSKCDLYISVICEIRKYIEEMPSHTIFRDGVLRILDKVKAGEEIGKSNEITK